MIYLLTAKKDNDIEISKQYFYNLDHKQMIYKITFEHLLRLKKVD